MRSARPSTSRSTVISSSSSTCGSPQRQGPVCAWDCRGPGTPTATAIPSGSRTRGAVREEKASRCEPERQRVTAREQARHARRPPAPPPGTASAGPWQSARAAAGRLQCGSAGQAAGAAQRSAQVLQPTLPDFRLPASAAPPPAGSPAGVPGVLPTSGIRSPGPAQRSAAQPRPSAAQRTRHQVHAPGGVTVPYLNQAVPPRRVDSRQAVEHLARRDVALQDTAAHGGAGPRDGGGWQGRAPARLRTCALAASQPASQPARVASTQRGGAGVTLRALRRGLAQRSASRTASGME